jgi:hypothetical protein
VRNDALRPYQERLDDLGDDLAERVKGFDPTLPDRPEPSPPPAVDERDVLFDTRRHWWAQLKRYPRKEKP